MKILQIHKVLQFFQETIFEPYISYNSQKRQTATSDFEKVYYKLKNNAVYGKTVENVRKRQDFRLVTTVQKLIKLASQKGFVSATSFNADLVGVKMMNRSTLLNKPIYIGATVLDLSNLIMYRHRYENFPKYEQEFDGTIRVISGDTDSFFLKCTNISVRNQLYPAMIRDGLLDTSNYPKDHELFSNKYKAQLGKVKDECAGKKLLECIFLKPKCYSFIVEGGLEKHKAKGIQRREVQRMTHAQYKKVYKTQQDITTKVRRITSEKHEIYTVEHTKWALWAQD